jgi:hypothetical protein
MESSDTHSKVSLVKKRLEVCQTDDGRFLCWESATRTSTPGDDNSACETIGDVFPLPDPETA